MALKQYQLRKSIRTQIKQFAEGDLDEWYEMMHACRVLLGKSERAQIARPIRVDEIVGLLRWPHQGRDFRPDRRQEINQFGHYAGIHGRRSRYGPVYHKVITIANHVRYATFDYILPLSHRRFFCCHNDLYEIVGGDQVVQRITTHQAIRQIADALDMVWHAANPPPEGVVLFPEQSQQEKVTNDSGEH